MPFFSSYYHLRTYPPPQLLNFLKNYCSCNMLIISAMKNGVRKTLKKVLKIFGSVIFLPLLCIRFRAKNSEVIC